MVVTGTRPAGTVGVAAALRRRRSVPHLLAGAVLVVAATLGVSLAVSALDDRAEVLVVARPVAAGQVLADADLVVARVSVDAAVATVPAGRRGELVGRVVLVPLPAGVLLSPEAVGPGPVGWPPAGEAVVAVPVRADRVPDGLVAGVRVQVVVVPQGGAAASGAGSGAGAAQDGDAGTPAGLGVVQAVATVVAVVDSPDQLGGVAVSVLMAELDATVVASTPGEVALVLLADGGGGS